MKNKRTGARRSCLICGDHDQGPVDDDVPSYELLGQVGRGPTMIYEVPAAILVPASFVALCAEGFS